MRNDVNEALKGRRNASGTNPPRPGGGKRANRSDRREKRAREALERAAVAASRTPEERLAILVAEGHGQCREAKELREEIRNDR